MSFACTQTHLQIADIASVLAQISVLGDTLKNVDTTDIASKLVAIQTTLRDGLSTQSYDLSQVAGMPPLLATTPTTTPSTTTTTTTIIITTSILLLAFCFLGDTF